MIVCYQYKTGKGTYFFSEATVYNMIPICAWKKKSFIGNAGITIPENSFYMQGKPIIDFLNTRINKQYNDNTA